MDHKNLVLDSHFLPWALRSTKKQRTRLGSEKENSRSHSFFTHPKPFIEPLYAPYPLWAQETP